MLPEGYYPSFASSPARGMHPVNSVKLLGGGGDILCPPKGGVAQTLKRKATILLEISQQQFPNANVY